MNRRDHLKTLVLGTAGTGIALTGCEPITPAVEAEIAAEATSFYGRTPTETLHDERLHDETFFTEHERETLVVLANTIMPPSEHGDIIDAEVPEFIEFMAKDVPRFQIPLRGGLAMLDQQAKQLFGKEYKELSGAEQAEILDPIAYYEPDQLESERSAGQNLFALIRGLVCTGYFTSEVGVKDLGYKGNQANIWDGVPQEVLNRYADLGIGYEDAWIAKCVDQSQREVIAEWDDAGNLLT